MPYFTNIGRAKGFYLWTLMLALFILNCGTSDPSTMQAASGGKNATFFQAKEALEDDDYVLASGFAWRFIRSHKPADENYENAEFILAKSFEGLKLYDMAMEYYVEVIRHGATKELITESLKSVVDTMEHRPFDLHLIEGELLAGMEFDFLPKELSGYINYIQGKIDTNRGDKGWAKDKFSKIEKETLPAYKVKYSQAIEKVGKNSMEDAKEILRDIADHAPKEYSIRDLALQTIARIIYGEKKYPESLAEYEKIGSSVLYWGDIFLEKAWNAYWLNDYQRALGYVHALSAPVFDDMVQPERYLLLGMVMKNMCLYQEAQDVIVHFRELYASSIDEMRKGRPLNQIPLIVKASAKNYRTIAQVGFLRSLEKGNARVKGIDSEIWKKNGLDRHLTNLYGLKIREVKEEIKVVEEEALKSVSEDLLFYNEQMNVLEYETRMDEFRRSAYATNDGSPVVREKKKHIVSDVIHWPFNGEYWIDELDHYLVKIDSKCKN